MVLELPVLYFLRCTDCIFHAIETRLFASYRFDLCAQDGYWTLLHVKYVNQFMDGLWQKICKVLKDIIFNTNIYRGIKNRKKMLTNSLENEENSHNKSKFKGI